MQRSLYDDDHEEFRSVVREYVNREVVSNIERWEEQRLVDRAAWIAAGSQGILGISAGDRHGGAGQNDYRYRNVVMEELARVHATSLAQGFSIQDDIVIPYLSSLGTPEQLDRWLPPMVRGEVVGAIAMTEPGTGSDLRGIRTSAKRVSDGWVLNGAKTFITNGSQADLVIVVARTDPEGGSRGFSLLVVERAMAGFERGRKLNKVGLHGQDTAELSFTDVFVPDENVLGEIGGGFQQLVHHLPLERLSIAAHAVAATSSVVDDTIRYTNERMAFGKPIADFQNTRFELADVVTELDVTRSFLDAAIHAYNRQDLTAVDAAKAKLFATEAQHRIVDRCLQLFGGYGFMLEYPVGRAYQDSRVQRIYGGTSEIMREIISRDIVGRR